MKHKKYLNQFELNKFWQDYNTSFSFKEAIANAGISTTCGYAWIKDIQKALAGEKITRSKGAEVLRLVVKNLKKEKTEKEVTPPIVEPVKTNGFKASNLTEMTAEERVNFLFANLKEAIADLAIEMASEKTKMIVEQAQASNVIGLIKKGWSTSNLMVNKYDQG